MAVALQAASRDSLNSVNARLDAYAATATPAQLGGVTDELFAVVRLLVAERPLRRLLGDPATPAEARAGLARQVLGSKLSAPALELVTALVSARWSASADLVSAAEAVARQAALAVAEKDGSLDDVEDELFRFGRIVAGEPRLGTLLADPATPADGRVRLLESVAGGRVRPITAALLAQAVRLPRSRHLDVVAEELAELAAGRRDRSVAKVRTPVALTAQQEQRLADTLGRLYGRPISLQVELDPRLLGGLVVQVGGEVIDGSVAGKLAAARRALPS